MNFVTKYRFVAAVFMQQFSQCDILSQSDLEWGGGYLIPYTYTTVIYELCLGRHVSF